MPLLPLSLARFAARLTTATAMGLVLAAPLSLLPVTAAHAQEIEAPSPFAQALATAAAGESDLDQAIATFYAARAYAPVWTVPEAAEMRSELFSALARAPLHGLPAGRYDPATLIAQLRAAKTEGDRGRAEFALTRAFVSYANDLHSGALIPHEASPGIKRVAPRLPADQHLAAMQPGQMTLWLQQMEPTAPAYAQLIRARLDMIGQIAKGGWGAPLPVRSLKPGQSGEGVVALRDRLVAMGYLTQTATRDYDDKIKRAVQRFQLAHGLQANGVAGESTIKALNVPPEERLEQILVSLERERWMNIDRGARHVWVNLTDFTAKIIDHGKVAFSTRSVIGKNVPDQQSPEFSDEMETVVINPSWNVPYSITVKEYLPLMQRNPGAVGHLQLINSKGEVVSRGSVNFGRYSAKSFPFALRQPPSSGNALGVVKFLFPNEYNIYLHDTPSKSLFDNEVRAYSHGCIRLGDPVDFAYEVLSSQVSDPREYFHQMLDTKRETPVRLEQKIPVHIAYFTAFPDQRGRIQYRADIYGRDADILQALTEAGVELVPHQG